MCIRSGERCTRAFIGELERALLTRDYSQPIESEGRPIRVQSAVTRQTYVYKLHNNANSSSE